MFIHASFDYKFKKTEERTLSLEIPVILITWEETVVWQATGSDGRREEQEWVRECRWPWGTPALSLRPIIPPLPSPILPYPSLPSPQMSFHQHTCTATPLPASFLRFIAIFFFSQPSFSNLSSYPHCPLFLSAFFKHIPPQCISYCTLPSIQSSTPLHVTPQPSYYSSVTPFHSILSLPTYSTPPQVIQELPCVCQLASCSLFIFLYSYVLNIPP